MVYLKNIVSTVLMSLIPFFKGKKFWKIELILLKNLVNVVFFAVHLTRVFFKRKMKRGGTRRENFCGPVLIFGM